MVQAHLQSVAPCSGGDEDKDLYILKALSKKIKIKTTIKIYNSIKTSTVDHGQ